MEHDTDGKSLNSRVATPVDSRVVGRNGVMLNGRKMREKLIGKVSNDAQYGDVKE